MGEECCAKGLRDRLEAHSTVAQHGAQASEGGPVVGRWGTVLALGAVFWMDRWGTVKKAVFVLYELLPLSWTPPYAKAPHMLGRKWGEKRWWVGNCLICVFANVPVKKILRHPKTPSTFFSKLQLAYWYTSEESSDDLCPAITSITASKTLKEPHEISNAIY